MKKILYILSAFLVLASCAKEEKLVPNFEYNGPFPAITDGPTETHKMCYKLFKKYDIAFYFDREGDAALETEIGSIQTNPIYSNNPEAMPPQPADEAKALKQLQLIEKVYDLFPLESILTNIYRYQVLVKVNPANNHQYNSDKTLRYRNTFSEAQIGALMYGDLDAEIEVKPEDSRNQILMALLSGWISYNKYNEFPESFTSISAPYYKGVEDEDGVDNSELCFVWGYIGEDEHLLYDVETGYEYGFVGPEGASCHDSSYAYGDMISYGYWLLTNPQEVIDEVMSEYPLVATKAAEAKKWYKQNIKVDLDEIRPLFLAIK